MPTEHPRQDAHYVPWQHTLALILELDKVNCLNVCHMATHSWIHSWDLQEKVLTNTEDLRMHTWKFMFLGNTFLNSFLRFAEKLLTNTELLRMHTWECMFLGNTSSWDLQEKLLTNTEHFRMHTWKFMLLGNNHSWAWQSHNAPPQALSTSSTEDFRLLDTKIALDFVHAPFKSPPKVRACPKCHSFFLVSSNLKSSVSGQKHASHMETSLVALFQGEPSTLRMYYIIRPTYSIGCWVDNTVEPQYNYHLFISYGRHILDIMIFIIHGHSTRVV